MGKYITVVTKQTKLASIINLQEYIVIQTLAVESRYINWKKERKKKNKCGEEGRGIISNLTLEISPVLSTPFYSFSTLFEREKTVQKNNNKN